MLEILGNEELRASIVDLPDAVLEKAISRGSWTREEAAKIVDGLAGKPTELFVSLDLSEVAEERLREIGVDGNEAFRKGIGAIIYNQNAGLKAAREKQKTS